MESPPSSIVTPTDEQVQDAAHVIRAVEPGLGQLKLLARLKEENGWALSEKRFRRLVPSTVVAGIDAAIAEALLLLEEDEDDDDEDNCSSDWESDASGESMGYGHYEGSEHAQDSDGSDDADLEADLPEGPKEGHPGNRKAMFTNSKELADDAFAKQIGWKTRVVRFKWNFKLTDEHIDKIVALGPAVCTHLTDFVFEYEDVSYGAHNDARSVTSDGVMRLASACPQLHRVQLQGTEKMGDAPLLAFLEKCPNLKDLDISQASKCSSPVSRKALQTICQHSEWAAQLKNLRIEDTGSQPWKKELLKLSRARPLLKIEVVKVNEVKEWDDWELCIMSKTYQNGEEVNSFGDVSLQDFDDDAEYNNYLMTGDISMDYLARHGY